MSEFKGKLLFVDSNIFLRLLVADNPQFFKECRNFFKFLKTKEIKFYSSTLVCLEINFVLLRIYKFPRKDVLKALESITQTSGLKFIDNFQIKKALNFYQKKNIKFVDCLLASLDFFQKGGVIISYDKDFDHLGIKRLEPKDFI